MLRGLAKARVILGARTSLARTFSSWTAKADGDTQFDFGRPFKGYLIDPPESHGYSNKDEMIEFFKTMAYYRRFEIVCDTLYKARQIRGFCHLYDGQEAIVIGMEAALKQTDSVITAYRDHCHQLARGDTGASVMGELLGKETGCSRGKGGSMHLYYPEHNFFGGNGIVGAQVPLGVGLGFAHKYKGDGGVAVAAYGDGAANQGQIFEVYNMASIWKLPVIFVCENNDFAMGTATHRHAASLEFYKRGHFVPGIWADGMDVVASKTAFQFCAEHCRAGNGPIILELSTYRYHGHSMSDPGISYRTRDEVDSVRRERDPIDLVKRRLQEKEWMTAKEIKAVEKAVRKQVDEEVATAKAQKELPLENMFMDIYVNKPPPFVRHVDHQNSLYTGDAKSFYTG